ncbi:MAG: hypothetical protein D6754_06400 [Alphaproteobacteria bacterium]|nr:MAG: hypothetical protein D6754_06400 [Alphaproteobacteria bacterium]
MSILADVARELGPDWLDSEVAPAFEAEILRELSPDHPLRGLQLEAIARYRGSDDVLFRVEDGPFEYVIVHLTWSQEREGEHPHFSTFMDLDDLAARWRDVMP